MEDPAQFSAVDFGHVPRGDEPPSALLLYDGVCRFCDGTVRFVLARDRPGRMLFAPLGGPTAEAVVGRHPDLVGVDSLILIRRVDGREEVAVRSEAVIRIGEYLGGAWRGLALLRLVPTPLRDWGYKLFARHRYRIFGRFDTCPLPAIEVRRRFLP